jgi:hypothetical protein
MFHVISIAAAVRADLAPAVAAASRLVKLCIFEIM